MLLHNNAHYMFLFTKVFLVLYCRALEKSQSDAQLAAQKNEIKQLHDDKGKLVKEIQLLTESKRKLTSVESEKTHIQNELHKSIV